MRRFAGLCMCILLSLMVPAIALAAPMGEENVTVTPEDQEQMENVTIAAVIAQEENLTTLATAVNATNLTDTLDTGGPYTVFAPTDEAFQALGNETLGDLLNDTGTLGTILQYHVVEGNYTAEALLNMTQQQNMTMLQTLAGQNLTLKQVDGRLMVDNATVVQADLNASNGVIHAIDAVLTPPANQTEQTEQMNETPAATM